MRALLSLVLLIAIPACQPKPPDETPVPSPTTSSAPAPAITDRDWELSALGEIVEPRGNGGQPVTLRLDSASSRASGSAGCNRYSATYTLSGDSLTFGPGMSTKMACPDGMEIESRFLTSLASFKTFLATDTTLVLGDATGPLARFRLAAP